MAQLLTTKTDSGSTVATSGMALVLGIAACKLAVHVCALHRYGYFVDELYYLACSRHLAWGYVDQPPLIAVVTWLVRHTLGQSLPAIRFLPALAGTALVLLTGLIERELGGNRFAQALAALGILVAPAILVMDSLFTMNAFEPLFWMGCAYLLIRIIKTGNPKLWIWFGILAGFGLETKYSMGLFGTGIVVGLLLTPQRRLLANRWLWIGGAIAFLIFLPNLAWNIHYHFPFLELLANIKRSGRDVPLGPVQFFGQEILSMHPLALVIVILSPRVYYLFPAFPILFAGGGVMWEQWLARPRFTWVRWAYAALLILTGAIMAPLAVPVLPVEKYIAYTKAMHLAPPRIETHKLGPLPQLYADQFGWEEMTATVARVYNSLPPGVRANTAIFGQNYGQAGAIDLFGPKYGLPPAISGHQSYFLWGPREYTGQSMIVMDDNQEELETVFTSVQKVATVYHPYSMPYEHFDVFYCRGLKGSIQQLWPKVKTWD